MKYYSVPLIIQLWKLFKQTIKSVLQKAYTFFIINYIDSNKNYKQSSIEKMYITSLFLLCRNIKMDQKIISQQDIQQTINFHGHSCPGLAYGIRVAEFVLTEFNYRASDEELVAVVETDNCAVDAIQFLTGCTLGKGNMISLNYGKNVFSFFRRSDGKGVRIAGRSTVFSRQNKELFSLRMKKSESSLTLEENEKLLELITLRIEMIMNAEFNELFETDLIQGPVPKKAIMLESLTCQSCNEPTMESHTRRFLGKTICIPCFETLTKRF